MLSSCFVLPDFVEPAIFQCWCSPISLSFPFPSITFSPLLSVAVELVTERPVVAGCTSNSDCPDHAACYNTRCINPCAERSPCAPSAYCKVVNHQAVCTCPDGYIGTPTTNCLPRKYCMTDRRSVAAAAAAASAVLFSFSPSLRPRPPSAAVSFSGRDNQTLCPEVEFSNGEYSFSGLYVQETITELELTEHDPTSSLTACFSPEARMHPKLRLSRPPCMHSAEVS